MSQIAKQKKDAAGGEGGGEREFVAGAVVIRHSDHCMQIMSRNLEALLSQSIILATLPIVTL
jgi:hypothetical protein